MHSISEEPQSPVLVLNYSNRLLKNMEHPQLVGSIVFSYLLIKI